MLLFKNVEIQSVSSTFKPFSKRQTCYFRRNIRGKLDCIFWQPFSGSSHLAKKKTSMCIEFFSRVPSLPRFPFSPPPKKRQLAPFSSSLLCVQPKGEGKLSGGGERRGRGRGETFWPSPARSGQCKMGRKGKGPSCKRHTERAINASKRSLPPWPLANWSMH